MLGTTIFLAATSWCFAQTARSKHYRPLEYLCRAPRATGVVINKLRLGRRGKERILEIYYGFQFSTYVQRGSHVGRK